MFILLKLIKPFLLPPTLLALAWAIGVVLVRRPQSRRAGTRVCVGALMVYLLLAIEPFAYVLAWSLERQYAPPPTLAGMTAPVAIVVLAGGADEAEGRRQAPELGGQSWRRFWRGVAAYRELGGTVPVIYSGGSGDPFRRTSSEAVLAKEYAVAMGIPESAFWVETQSRTTYENGVAVQRLLRERLPASAPQTIFLVTSAQHMPRAVGVFTKLGVTVIPLPADYQTSAFRFNFLSIFPSATAFASSVSSLHEWIGMMGYRVLGRM